MLKAKLLKSITLSLACVLPFTAPVALAKDLAEAYQNYSSANFVVIGELKDTYNAELARRLNKLPNQVVYASKQDLQKAKTASVKIGYFDGKNSATDFLASSELPIANLSILKIGKKEHQQIVKLVSANAELSEDSFLLDNEYSMRLLMDAAKQAFRDKDYALSGRYYNVLAYSADEEIATWAIELYGLTEERQGHTNNAINIYESLALKLTDSKSKKRIEQRIRGLKTATLDPNSSLREAKSRAALKPFTYNGFVGLNYRNLNRQSGQSASYTVTDSLSTYYRARGTYNNGNHSVTGDLNGYQVLDDREDGRDLSQIKAMSVNYTNRAFDFSTTLGRQKVSDTGLYREFDGLSATYEIPGEIPVLSQTKIGVATGSPYYRSDAYSGVDHSFFSVFANTTVNSKLDINAYLINQDVGAYVERNALGARIYYRPTKALNGVFNFDYDLEYGKITQMLTRLTWVINSKSHVSGSFGVQNTPTLQTSNVLIGNTENSLAENLDVSDQDPDTFQTPQQLAEYLTSENTYFSANYSYKLTPKISLLADFYSSSTTGYNYEETNPNADQEVESYTFNTDYDYTSIGGRLMYFGSKWLNHTSTLGMRLADGTYGDSQQFYYGERIRLLNNKLFLTPQVTYVFNNRDWFSVAFGDYYQNERTHWRYSLQGEYKIMSNLGVTLTMGNESITGDTLDSNSDYLFIGGYYRF